jgi:hypothetical protein
VLPLHELAEQALVGKLHAPVEVQAVAPQVPPTGLQAVAQQFPVPLSPQMLVEHCALAVQGWPGAFRQTAPLQVYPVMQSLLEVHEPLQPVPPHL